MIIDTQNTLSLVFIVMLMRASISGFSRLS